MNMQAMMAQAQKLQKDIQNKKNEINNSEFTGTSELIEVVFNGKKEMKSIKIKMDQDLTKEDIEILEDMIIIAVNDAMSQIEKETKAKMGAYGNLDGLI